MGRQYSKQGVERESSSKTMNDDEMAEFIRVKNDKDEEARRTAGESGLPKWGKPIKSRQRQGLSSSDRENFRKKVSRLAPDGHLQYKGVGYEIETETSSI